MKKIFVLLNLIVLFTLNIFAQDPCGWCGTTTQADSIDWAAQRFEGIIPGLGDSIPPPVIDGTIEPLWMFVDSVPINQFRNGLNPDSNISGIARFLYDAEWLYLLVHIKHDNEIYYAGTAQNQLDRIRVMFQNTWGGRKDSTYHHCNEDNWWWWYWEQDGDRQGVFTVDKTYPLLWLDQDGQDGCTLPHACEEKEMPDWPTLESSDQVLYAVDTARMQDGTWEIIYEIAFNLENYLKYDNNTPAVQGHDLGLEISVKDVDAGELTGHFNMSYPENREWCTTLAISKFTLGEVMPKPAYNVTINVMDEELNSISGASVVLEGYGTKTTNAGGQVVFDNIPDNDTHDYNVSKSGYELKTGTLTVDGLTTVNVLLKRAYNVSFNVFDANLDPVQNANVLLNGYGTKTTNVIGEAAFNNVVAGYDMNYTVTASGFQSKGGIFDTLDADITKNVQLFPGDESYNVTYRMKKPVIYPNPTSTILFIQTPEEIINNILIYHPDGRLLKSYAPSTRQINTSGLMPGIYIIDIDNQRMKFIKE